MTRYSLKLIVYFSFLLPIFILFLHNRSEAQSRKVIIIYDTIRVVDTVRVRPPNSPYFSLHKPLNSINPIYTNGENYWNGDACSSEKLIITQIDFNRDKRGGYFNRLVQTMYAAFLKVDLTFSTGENNMWLQHHASTINNPAWVGPQGSMEMRYFMKKSHFVLSTGGNYSWHRKLQSHIQTGNYSTASTDQYEYAMAKTAIILADLNSGAFSGDYSELFVPIKLHYCKLAIQPYAGLLFRLNRFSYIEPNSNQTILLHNTFDWGWVAGVEYRLKKHLGIKLEINQSLRPITNTTSYMVSSMGTDQYSYKMLQANLSMCFHFKEFKKENFKKRAL